MTTRRVRSGDVCRGDGAVWVVIGTWRGRKGVTFVTLGKRTSEPGVYREADTRDYATVRGWGRIGNGRVSLADEPGHHYFAPVWGAIP